ncbi:hypothetical protein ACWD4O_01655 [Streptomyces sp. NPDC002623]
MGAAATRRVAGRPKLRAIDFGSAPGVGVGPGLFVGFTLIAVPESSG